MHHKFLVIDDTNVITGSFNWTNQASKSNMENIVVVEDQNIAKKYINEFNRIWQLIASKSIEEYLTDKLSDDTEKKKDDVDFFIDELRRNRTKYNLVELRSDVVKKLLQLKEKGEYKKGRKIFDFLKEQNLDLKGNYLPDLEREFSNG
jgi:phosphatidylserine/phosphatidylglycerophosphate/cardiolipin synthase-like enzyme